MNKSNTYLCGAEPGAANNCRHLRLFSACATGDCRYEPWPKRRSFWCWIRRHRMLVAGYDYHLEDGWQGNIEPIRVCQCKLNNTAIPTFVDQLRNQQ